MYDLVLRNGRMVDGLGGEPYMGDLAVEESLIREIGRSVSGRGKREIDVNGALITPGFVDIHTHYDGQATWDDRLEPSASHGVTTVVMGNCGVGFAPVMPGQQDVLIELMEGVEDIPGTALHEGIGWQWQTFEEYLDCLDAQRWSMDVAAQVPHGAVRAYVMGERGVLNQASTADDIEAMAALTARALGAVAVGFSTSRILGHQSMQGEPVPGTFAGEDETFAIGRAVAAQGGVFQLVPGGSTGQAGITLGAEAALEDELDWMERLSRAYGVPVTFLVTEFRENPDAWQLVLDRVAAANRAGAALFPQTASRPAGILISWQSRHRFMRRPTYLALEPLPLDARLRELAKPEVRAAILSEQDTPALSDSINDAWHRIIAHSTESVFPLGNPVDYEPAPETSIANIARSRGQSPDAVMYDLMMGDDGHAILMMPALNYARGNCNALHDMLASELTVVGLADGGAHYGMICDASCSTFLLTHWVRDRQGPRLPLAYVVKKQCADTATLYGFTDRGVLVPGRRADLNVIDFDRLSLDVPYVVHDLPAGGQRFLQNAHGYDLTMVAGQITRESDQDTGTRPGRLIRGRRS